MQHHAHSNQLPLMLLCLWQLLDDLVDVLCDEHSVTEGGRGHQHGAGFVNSRDHAVDIVSDIRKQINAISG